MEMEKSFRQSWKDRFGMDRIVPYLCPIHFILMILWVDFEATHQSVIPKTDDLLIKRD